MKPGNTSKKLPADFPRTPEEIEAAVAAATDGARDLASVEAAWRDGLGVNGGGVEAVRQAHAVRRRRGPNKNPTKVQLTIRVKPDVIERWKATGDGWQTRMAEALERAAERMG